MWYAGQGGGVPDADTQGRILFHDEVRLPKGAEPLAGALAECMAKRPASTDPPAPSP